ncbi:MAG TPA: HNH endonuclease signature motif containing protein [Candidatus Anammoximicrobium sp.]|nr:HNH endonuclease signature motif containing protein [Candidatus Anammoximicrobium sp.]
MADRPSVPLRLREEVVERAGSACEYCRFSQHLSPDTFEVDHITPLAAGGRTESQNLCLACPVCNAAKGSKTTGRDPITQREVRLFHPRRQSWYRHFEWSQDNGCVVGRTTVGRATVATLKMNSPRLVHIRIMFAKLGLRPLG